MSNSITMRPSAFVLLLLIWPGLSGIYSEDPSIQEEGCYEFLRSFPEPFKSREYPYHFSANGYSFIFYRDGQVFFQGTDPDGRGWSQQGRLSSSDGEIILRLDYTVDLSRQCISQCTPFEGPGRTQRFKQWHFDFDFGQSFLMQQIASCQRYCYESVPGIYGKVIADFLVTIALRAPYDEHPGWVILDGADDPDAVPGKARVEFPFFRKWTPFRCDYVLMESSSK